MMQQVDVLNRKLEAVGWGSIFAWWGFVDLVGSLPHGVGAVGFGLILVGLSIARSRLGLPSNGFANVVGVVALVWGLVDVAGAVAALPFALPVFPILLIALGALMAVSALRRRQPE
jgi:hypothetical protein